MSGTSIPDVLDQLVTVWTAANVANLQVIDGEPYDVSGYFLAVGWDRTGQPAVAWTDQQFTAGGRRGQEAFDVSSLLSLATGDETPSQTRQQLFAGFDSLDAALAADRTLGGRVLKAWIAAGDMAPATGETGNFVDFRFTVHCISIK